MELHITTSQLDASVALRAHQLYKKRQFKEAIPVLLEILDLEPSNWQARLFVAVCYFKTGQSAASQRAFRFVYDKCTDSELKQKACIALQTVTAEIQKPKDIPAEFGSLADRVGRTAPTTQLESLFD